MDAQIRKVTRKVLRANGTEIPLPGPVSTAEIAAMLGAELLDSVVLADRLHVMLVDDAGHIKGLPVNRFATMLYRQRARPGATHVIRGDVVIVPDSDYEPAGG